MRADPVERFIAYSRKREYVLLHNLPVRLYNRYFVQCRKLARTIIDENRAEEMLPYLNGGDLFLRYSAACFFYNCFPEQCRRVLEEISEMTIPTGLPKHLVMISMSAYGNLKYGIPKDFP